MPLEAVHIAHDILRRRGLLSDLGPIAIYRLRYFSAVFCAAVIIRSPQSVRWPLVRQASQLRKPPTCSVAGQQRPRPPITDGQTERHAVIRSQGKGKSAISFFLRPILPFLFSPLLSSTSIVPSGPRFTSNPIYSLPRTRQCQHTFTSSSSRPRLAQLT